MSPQAIHSFARAAQISPNEIRPFVAHRYQDWPGLPPLSIVKLLVLPTPPKCAVAVLALDVDGYPYQGGVQQPELRKSSVGDLLTLTWVSKGLPVSPAPDDTRWLGKLFFIASAGVLSLLLEPVGLFVFNITVRGVFFPQSALNRLDSCSLVQL